MTQSLNHSNSGGNCLTYCLVGSIVSLLAVSYSFHVPWALMYLHMSSASYTVKVPVLLWQGCFEDAACMVSPVVDSQNTYSNLEYNPTDLMVLSNILLLSCFSQFLGIAVNIMACSIHLFDIFKIPRMHPNYRFVYPTAVACNLLSLAVLFPTLMYYMQGGFFLSGYVTNFLNVTYPVYYILSDFSPTCVLIIGR
jgi:hypothetical protein